MSLKLESVSVLPFGISTQKLFPAFPGVSLDFQVSCRKFFREGRGWQRQECTISQLYPSAMATFASNLLKTPIISGILNPAWNREFASMSCCLGAELGALSVGNVVGMLVAPSLVLLFPGDVFVDKRVPPTWDLVVSDGSEAHFPCGPVKFPVGIAGAGRGIWTTT